MPAEARTTRDKGNYIWYLHVSPWQWGMERLEGKRKTDDQFPSRCIPSISTGLRWIDLRGIFEQLSSASEHSTHVIQGLQRCEQLNEVLFTMRIRRLNQRALWDSGQRRLSLWSEHGVSSLLHLSSVDLCSKKILLHALSEYQWGAHGHTVIRKLQLL